jgi:hypothetical protein
VASLLLAAAPLARAQTSQKIELVGRSRKGAYDDEAPMKKRRWIPEAY